MSQIEAFNKSVYKDLAEYYDDSPVEPHFKKILLDTVGTGNTVLDVGCGSGRYSVIIKDAGNTVYGIDIVEEALQTASKRGIITSQQDLCAKWSFEDASFNRMTCIEVLEHLVEPDNTLNEMYRCLSTDGQIFLSVPNTAWWKHRFSLVFGKTTFCDGDGFTPANNPHIRHYTFSSMERILKAHGFEIVKKFATYGGAPGLTTLARAGVFISLLSAGVVMRIRKAV